MIAVGFGVAWLGYATFMWGVCLLRDYNVTVPDLFKSVWPGAVAGGSNTPSSQVVPSPTGQVSRAQQFLGQ